MVSVSDELKERNILVLKLKLILIVRFTCATLDVRHRICCNPYHLVCDNRLQLHRSEACHNWIDLIFGCLLRGGAAIQQSNVFTPVYYCNHDELVSKVAVREWMREFGSVPVPLFYEPHPPRLFGNGELQLPSRLQPLKSVASSEVLLVDAKFQVKSSYDPFRELHFGEIKMCDGIFRWEISSFECCAFSNDRLFFCGILGNGTRLLSGLLIRRLEWLGTCFLPPEFIPISPSRSTSAASRAL
jgi:hypothetical protein